MWQPGGTAPRGLPSGSPAALGRDWKDVRSALAREGGDCQPQKSDAGESRFLFLPKKLCSASPARASEATRCLSSC